MRKILLLTENFPPIEGGSGRWFWELYSRLPREQVVIMAHNCKGASEFDSGHDLRVLREQMKSREWGVKSITGMLFYFRMIRLVYRAVKQHKVTEIHCGRVLHEGVTAWIVSKLARIPFFCFVHGEDVETAATSREQRALVKAVCTYANLIICNSYNSKRLVEELSFYKGNKCQVLHPGVDSARFIPSAPDLKFREKMGWGGKRVVLTVGRLQKRKGQDYLLKCMPRLLQDDPILFYAVVGKGECFEELQSLIDTMGLHNNVQIYPNLNDEDLIRCYQQCDLFVLPNRTIENDIEGFGMVLVEAQCCGKAVVAGNSGGTAETMLQGETGYIIDCDSVDSVYKYLSPILKKTDLDIIGDRASRFARETFSWDKHVKRATELFEKWI